MKTNFIQKLTETVEANYSNELFGSKELAEKMGMNRVQLYRKLKAATNQSAGEFIREFRLKKGKELLENEELNVSEVSFRVGFASPTYFSKCFRDYFGYPPVEIVKGNINDETSDDLIPGEQTPPISRNKKRRIIVISVIFSMILILWILVFVLKPFFFRKSDIEKSVVVLPILSIGEDVSNNIIAEGLFEEIINKLQIIKEIRVITRTTADTYRNSNKTINEIARELGVNYVLEGSAQTVNGSTHIRLQLIEAETEKALWVNPFNRIVSDENIFEIQQEIAGLVAKGIKANISPSEHKKIAFSGTENEIAYTYYIQGRAIWRMLQREETLEQLYKAKSLFLKAIEEDSTFSPPMYELGWTLIFESRITKNKEKWDSAIILADKAVKYNSQYAEGYNLKGYVTRHNEKEQLRAYDMGIKINPEQASNYGAYASYYFVGKRDYSNAVKSSFKVCEVIKEPVFHSTTLQYLSTSFALMQFDVLAEKYINLYYATYNIKYRFLHLRQLNQMMSGNYERAIEIGLENYKDNPTNMNTLDYLGQCYLFLNDIDNAKLYYDKYKNRLETFPVFRKVNTVFDSSFPNYWPINSLYLDIFPMLHMIYIEKKLGNTEFAETYRNLILDNMEEMIECKDEPMDYYEEDQNYVLENYISDYKLACLYATFDENDKAIEHIKNILKREPNPVWLVNFLKDNPMLDNIREHPDFIRVLGYMEKEYGKEKKKIAKLIAENQSIIP